MYVVTNNKQYAEFNCDFEHPVGGAAEYEMQQRQKSEVDDQKDEPVYEPSLVAWAALESAVKWEQVTEGCVQDKQDGIGYVFHESNYYKLTNKILVGLKICLITIYPLSNMSFIRKFDRLVHSSRLVGTNRLILRSNLRT